MSVCQTNRKFGCCVSVAHLTNTCATRAKEKVIYKGELNLTIQTLYFHLIQQSALQQVRILFETLVLHRHNLILPFTTSSVLFSFKVTQLFLTSSSSSSRHFIPSSIFPSITRLKGISYARCDVCVASLRIM
jgi:hypothetical protein